MEPGVVALLGGLAGALVMLLIVLLAVIGIALPIGRAGVRFLGNFENASAQRRGGKVLLSGGFDDWREREEARAPGPTDITGGPLVIGPSAQSASEASYATYPRAAVGRTGGGFRGGGSGGAPS